MFFRDFSCGFRVPSTFRDPQGEMMCLRSAKIAATNDRCPSCPPRHFPLFASPESDCVHLPKSLSLLRTVFLRHTPPPTGSCRGAIGHTIFLSKSAFSIFARQSRISSPILLRYTRRLPEREELQSRPAEIFSFAFLPSSPAIEPFQSLARFLGGTGNGERLCGNGEWLENDHQHLTNFFAHFVKQYSFSV